MSKQVLRSSVFLQIVWPLVWNLVKTRSTHILINGGRVDEEDFNVKAFVFRVEQPIYTCIPIVHLPESWQ
jgi:hypothetical protein